MKPSNKRNRKRKQRESNESFDPIKFDLPPAGTFKQLVNNSHMADIRFKVGLGGELFYAHKLVITMASEVFHTQFHGGFSESERNTLDDPVVVEDIEPAPFLELLRYIYCGEVNIGFDNMLDIYYASEKYMLRNLGMLCEDNFYRQITETTVLQVFDQNRRYEFPAVDTICFEMICDNPLKFFIQKTFLSLDQQAVRLIASRSAMNCRVDQLEQAIAKWSQCNEKTEIAIQLRKMLCQKLYFYDKCRYSSNIDTRFSIDKGCSGAIALYGLGVYVGVEEDTPMPNESVTISVELEGISVKETFPIPDELKVYEITFEKQLIDKAYEVCVNVTHSSNDKQLKMFHLAGWSTSDDTMLYIYDCGNAVPQYVSHGRNVRKTCYNCGSDDSYSTNCVAYLLYSKTKTEPDLVANSD